MYKAFDNKNKVWLDSFLLTPDGRVIIQEKQSGWQNYKDVVVDATVCRKTKYYCDNGDIHTGDIIKLAHQTGHEEWDEQIIEVVDESSIDLYFEDSYQEECEIIGNVLEHRHLLKR